MNTLGVAFVMETGEFNAYFLELIRGIIEGATLHDQTVTVFALRNWGEDAALRLPRFCDGRIDGLILLAPRMAPETVRYLPDHTPFVPIHSNVPLPGVVNIESDEENGAYLIVRHLIERGHRHILHFTGDRGLLGTERRIRGYLRALNDSGIAPGDDWIVDAGYAPETGQAVVRTWFRQHGVRDLPDAIFCANDAIACAALETFAEAGIGIPEDVSVVGFDDTIMARTTVPQLTTVRQPLRAMGQRAVEALLADVRQPSSRQTDRPPAMHVFPTEVVLRQSVADRRARPPV